MKWIIRYTAVNQQDVDRICTYLLLILNEHLTQRGGRCQENQFIFGENEDIIISQNSFHESEIKIYEININFQNFRNSNQYSVLIAVRLIEDLIRTNFQYYHFLEKLDENELLLVNSNQRILTPYKIANTLQKNISEINIIKPNGGPLGDFVSYDMTAIYYGYKKDYDSIIDFWLSILSYVFYDSIEYSPIEFTKKYWHFNENLGACIPMSEEEKNNYLPSIKKHLNINDNLKSAYLMNKEWSNKMYLFEFENVFVLHNWFTGE